MAQQTSYLNNPPAAINGLATHMEGMVVLSKLASGVVPVGLLCTVGTNSLTFPGSTTATADGHSPGQVIRFPASITDDPLLDSEFLGIPMYDSGRPPFGTDTTGTFVVGAYADQEYVPVLRKGFIYVLSENAVNDNADVYVRVTAATNNPRGQFSMSSGANKVKFARGRWAMKTAAAGLALMEVW